MYGPNPAPPSPSEGTRITLRVVFSVAAFLTCGMLSCLPLFRIATTRGRWYDWTAAWLSLPVSIAAFSVIGALPETDHRTDVAFFVLLLLGIGSAAYFVVFDIRDQRRDRSASPGYFAPQQGYLTQPQVGYGYPPQAPTPVPGARAAYAQAAPYPQSTPPQQGVPQQGVPQQGVPQQGAPQQPPQAPSVAPSHPIAAPQTPHRIDQVRAELDELSDLLRKDTDGRKGEGR